MYKLSLLLLSLLAAAAPTAAQGAAGRVLVGYWHNWPASPNTMTLAEVPDAYDVVNVAFALPAAPGSATMQFSPDPTIYPTSQDFAQDVAALQANGKKVLISIGGANHPVIVDSQADQDAFASSMLQLITSYGFDGVDVNLEGDSFSLQAGDTDFKAPTTPRVVHFLGGLSQLLAQLPADFILSAAPETAMVQGAMTNYAGVWGSYLPLLHAFRSRFDWVHVQHYNSGTMYGRDGQVYTPATVDFHVAMIDALLGGFTTANGLVFDPLAPGQVALGLPSTVHAATSGFTDTATVHAALDRLILGEAAAGYQLADPGGYPSLRGLMTWSINWDEHAGRSFSSPHRAYLDTLFLQSSAPSLSASLGGVVTLSLTAGRANAGRTYMLLAGFSGTSPGTALPGGGTLPLNLDPLSYAAANPAFSAIFRDFTGTLDASGEAAAELVVPSLPDLAGVQLSFAYSMPPWNFASTSVGLALTQ